MVLSLSAHDSSMPQLTHIIGMMEARFQDVDPVHLGCFVAVTAPPPTWVIYEICNIPRRRWVAFFCRQRYRAKPILGVAQLSHCVLQDRGHLHIFTGCPRCADLHHS